MSSKIQQAASKPVIIAGALIKEALSVLGQSPSRASHPPELEQVLTSATKQLSRPEITKDASLLVSIAAIVLDELKHTLELLQDLSQEEPHIIQTTKLIAKSLATLYPLAKSEENPSRIPASPFEVDSPRGSDRRTATRIAIEADIGFQSETNFFVGFTEDISEGGIFVSTYDIRKLGTRLAVNFALPNGHIVSAEGEVRWLREYNETNPDTPPGMGIQFCDLTGDDEKAIHNFIKQRQPLFFEE